MPFMPEDDRFNPYNVLLETPTKLHLRLNFSQRFLTFWLTIILPLFIISMIGMSIYFMIDDNETGRIWLLILVLFVPGILMFASSWPLVNIEQGKIEVRRKKLFNNKTFCYNISSENKIEVQWKRAYKTAAWEFVLIDEMGNRTVMFAIPDAPFKRRLEEKENILAALKHYSQPTTIRNY
jgi:hypothetical protein